MMNCISCFKKNKKRFNDFNIDKHIFKRCFYEYERYKTQNNLLDFEDIQVKCFELLKNDKNILRRYRDIYKHILIDEFQDCDPIQMEILKLISCKRNSIFAVGDEDQCIYGFRGADPYYIVNFENEFKDSKKFYLKINYRNPPNIVNISCNLIKNNKMRNEKRIVAYKQSKNKINIINSANEREQSQRICSIIQKYVSESSYEYRDMAVLYRTNNESLSIVESFISRKIPFKFLDHVYNFYDNAICKDILSYIKLSLDFCDKKSFLRIVNKPYRYISKDKIYKISLNNSKTDVFKLLISFDDLPYYHKRNIEKLKKDIDKLSKYTPAKCIDYIMKKLNYEYYLKEYSNKFKVSLCEMYDIVSRLKELAQNFNNTKEFISHVDKVNKKLLYKQRRKCEGNHVTLSTIHGAKGMEFNNVFLINCDENIMPHINSIEKNIEEERRLFYVAITRTIDNLYICYSQNIKDKKMRISRFVKECGILNNFNINDNLNIGDIVLHKVYGEGEIIEKCDKCIRIKFNSGIVNEFNINSLINNGLLIY